MIIKILEIRDRHTFISVVCMSIEPRKYCKEVWEIDKYYMWSRCGYPTDSSTIVMFSLNCPSRGCANSPYDWKDRTYQTAHSWIQTNWYDIKNGDVIDVEFILGESAEKKISERLT